MKINMSLYDGLGLDQDEISESIPEVKIPEKQPEKKVEPPKVEIRKGTSLGSLINFMLKFYRFSFQLNCQAATSLCQLSCSVTE